MSKLSCSYGYLRFYISKRIAKIANKRKRIAKIANFEQIANIANYNQIDNYDQIGQL